VDYENFCPEKAVSINKYLYRPIMKSIIVILLLIPQLAPGQKKKTKNTSTSVIKKQETILIDTTPLIIQDPQPLTPITPDYPQLAREANLEGKVYLRAYIDVTGEVIHVMVDKSGDTILEDAAIDAIKKTRFTPGTINGDSVKMWVSIPVEFSLDATHNHHR
jgi:TonB family protein